MMTPHDFGRRVALELVKTAAGPGLSSGVHQPATQQQQRNVASMGNTGMNSLNFGGL